MNENKIEKYISGNYKGDQNNSGFICGICKCHDLCLSGIQTNCILNGDRLIIVMFNGKIRLEVIDTESDNV